jgi:2-keto-4-pentenoate hydratase/2-oxohepta-3-ene-1,7-dioic acid hydratase in catechol pathway
MFIARNQASGPDGPAARIIAAADPTGTWIDVRGAERVRLERAGATGRAARRLAEAVAPSSLSAALETGPGFHEAVTCALSDPPEAAVVVGEPDFLIPVDPPAYRDFMVFERHFRFGSELRGLPVPEVLYEMPVSYFGNPFGFVGPNEELPWPHYTAHMDYELELGIVIGRGGRDVRPERALDHVLGLTILNDFSARDIQVREMTGGLGPSKGKHFGSALGPWIATLDELSAARLRMQARVSGELWSDASSAEMIWSIEEIVAWAMAAERIDAGTVLGSGTANGGSAIELGRKLEPGDEVELEIDGLGVLRNRLGRPGEGWTPQQRTLTSQEARV